MPPRDALRIVAEAVVAPPRPALHAMLDDLSVHWRLAGPWVDVLETGPRHGTVRVRGPLGLRRTVHTRVLESRVPELLAGEAVAGSTRAAIRWELEEARGGTRVTLSAEVGPAAPADRLLLAVGGAWWLRRRLRTTIRRLAEAAVA